MVRRPSSTVRVELVVDLVADAVLLAADDADLDLEDDAGLGGQAQQLVGDGEVLLHRHGGAVPHVGLEERVLAAVDALLGDGDQRADVAVQLVLGAVVGVQGDVDRVVLGHLVRVRGEGDGTGDLFLMVGPDAYSAPPVETWMMPSEPASAKPCRAGVQGLRRADVDGRVGEGALLGRVDHLGVDLGSGDGHAGGSSHTVRAGASARHVGAAPAHGHRAQSVRGAGGREVEVLPAGRPRPRAGGRLLAGPGGAPAQTSRAPRSTPCRPPE